MALAVSDSPVTKGGQVIPSITFIGPMASGKNAYCDALQRRMQSEFGVVVHRPAFSAKISEVAEELFPDQLQPGVIYRSLL